MDNPVSRHSEHDVAGLCGHCGKRTCAGRQGHSVLPDRLSRDDVIAAGIKMQKRVKNG
jgi:hypothetical protein